MHPLLLAGAWDNFNTEDSTDEDIMVNGSDFLLIVPKRRKFPFLRSKNSEIQGGWRRYTQFKVKI